MSGTTPSSEINDLRNQLDVLRATDPTPKVEAAKQTVSDTVDGVAAQASDLASQAADQASVLASDAKARLSDAAEAVAEPVRAAVASVRQTAAQASDGADSLAMSIRSAPVLSIALAALAGYMVGRIVR